MLSNINISEIQSNNDHQKIMSTHYKHLAAKKESRMLHTDRKLIQRCQADKWYSFSAALKNNWNHHRAIEAIIGDTT